MIDIGDIVIFTIREVTEMEYVVSLDDYDDTEAYINLIDSLKKLKIGSKNFGEVTKIYSSLIYLQVLDTTIDDRKLFKLCRKLSYLDGPKDGWYSVCHNAIVENGEHPIITISDRSFVENRPEVFPKEYNDCIIRNHAKLFGYKPIVRIDKIKLVSFDDNEIFKEKLIKEFDESYSKRYCDSELYRDWSRFNISVTPVALPIFMIRVSAYLESKFVSVMAGVKEYLFSL